jgi:L-lactate utilization protein LutC
MEWTNLADEKALEKTVESLKKRGFEVQVAEGRDDAKAKALALIPGGSEVMEMTSITLSDTGIAKALAQGGEYVSLRKKQLEITDEKERAKFRKLHLAPQYAIGSVHAITQDGQILVASGTGSQIPAYVFGADSVIFVVGTQKIVSNFDDAMRRIYEHSLPLESERINRLYNTTSGSSVSKILIIEKERQGRIKIILVKEKLGF